MGLVHNGPMTVKLTLTHTPNRPALLGGFCFF
jgi:hypothetical protein